MISFNCPECGNGMKVPNDAAGKRGKCKHCGETIRVPSPKRKPAQEIIVNEREEYPEYPAVRQKPQSLPQIAPVTVQVHQEKRSTSSLGITSLILGILAFLFCWVPVINFVSILLGGMGLLLACIGIILSLVRNGTGIGFSIGGGMVNGIALMVSVVMWGGIIAVGGGAAAVVQEGIEQHEAEQERQNRVLTTPADDATPDTTPDSTADINTSEPTDTLTPEPETKPTDEWANASGLYEDEQVKVSITGLKVGKVPLEYLGRDSSSEDDLLMIGLEVFNKSQNKKMEFAGWKGADFSGNNAGSLQDEHENKYKRINFGIGTDVVGQAKSESVYPQKGVADLLVFELLIDSAKQIRLKLPASAYGGTGIIHLVHEARAEKIEPAKPVETAGNNSTGEPFENVEPTAELDKPTEKEIKAKKDAEETAQKRLEGALKFYEVDGVKGVRYLRRLVKAYPETEAGKEAARILQKIAN